MQATTTPTHQVGTRRAATWAALLLLAIYLLSAGGQPFISDGEVMLITSMRIVDERTVSLPEGAAIYPQTVRRADGVLFSKYGLGQPLLAAPLYAVGRYGLGRLIGAGAGAFYVGRFLALLLPALATALAGGILCAWGARLYGSARAGVALALLFGIGTLAWPYSRFFFSEPLFTAALVAAAYAIYSRHPLLAGLALGYAIFTRVGGAVLLPAFALYLWLKTTDDGRRRTTDDRRRTTDDGRRTTDDGRRTTDDGRRTTDDGRRTTDDGHGVEGGRLSVVSGHASAVSGQWSVIARQFGWLALGGLPFALLMVGYNWVRFRTLFERGYANEGFTGNLLEGLYGLLLSPGKSVFLYVPLLLALPWAARPFARRFGAEAMLIGALTLITLLQSALWWIWWAGWGWGPRFLVPLMPFLVLPLGTLFATRAGRRGLIVLLALAIGVNLLGILVDFNIYINDLTHGDMAREAIYLYQPAFSPILAHLRALNLRHVPIASFALADPQFGFPEPWATLFSASFILLLLGAALGLWRALAQTMPTHFLTPDITTGEHHALPD